jgi:aspartate/methionine/tyrosine aminotransferase
MLRLFSRVCCLVGLFSLTTFVANAQEVVHALAGIVSAIDPTQQTISISTDDGSEGLFKDLTKYNASLDFDKTIRADSIAADAFTKKGAHVIVYYFGDGDVRTAVALRDLGGGPLQKISGSVYKFNKHEHLLTIKDIAGTSESFHIDPKTVAETAVGAVEGERFDPAKGDHVRITATLTDGIQDALFIRAN